MLTEAVVEPPVAGISDDYDMILRVSGDSDDVVVVEINQTCTPPAFTKLTCEGR